MIGLEVGSYAPCKIKTTVETTQKRLELIYQSRYQLKLKLNLGFESGTGLEEMMLMK
jgi:hypothetical protein